MLDREKVIVALDAKADQFATYAREVTRQRETLSSRIKAIQAYSYAQLAAFVDATGVAWPGALPTRELDRAHQLRIPFGRIWTAHEDARVWAREVLTNRPVLAVDGSQITPDKDLNIPVGAVQIGWFINPHRPGGGYTKDVEFEVLGPAELMEDAEDEADDRAMPNWRVNQERFVRECGRLCILMEAAAHLPDADKPLCFFDGSFIVSFAGQLRPERASPYLRAVVDLLDCSTRTRVPLVAFVDRSYSRDFVTLVDLIAGTADGGELTLSDAALYQGLLPNWGDRAPVFYCARRDKLSHEGRVDFYTDVAFTYVRLTRDRPPARVEMPRWLVEEDRVDEIMDLVRAECVVGTGYPYCVETADALAVISHADRARFYQLFEQFARQSKLTLVLTRKAASKIARR